MDTARLIAALTLAIDPQGQYCLAAAQRSAEVSPELHDLTYVATASMPVFLELSQTDEFKPGTGYWVRHGFGEILLQGRDAARALFLRAQRTGDPVEAVAWFQWMLAGPKASGHWVMALWGIAVADRVDLGQGVLLMPFEQLPESRAKEQFNSRGTGWLGTMNLPVMARRQPGAALLIPARVDRFAKDMRQGGFPQGQYIFPLPDVLNEVRLSLTLLGPSCPLNVGLWFEFDDRDLGQVSGISITSEYLEVIPTGFSQDTPIDLAEATVVVPRLLSFQKSRKRVLLALGRLNQAMRRRPSGDKALDLAIALEALLVDGGGENSHKVGLRAALLYSQVQAERLRARGIVGALYALRSRLVHSGDLDEQVDVRGQGKRPTVDVINEAAKVAATVVKSILERGAVPDASEWYRLELSGGVGDIADH